MTPPMPNRPNQTRGSCCTSPSPSWLGVIAGLLVGAVLVAGCGKKGAPSTEAPAAEAGAGDSHEPAMAEEEPQHVLDELAGYEVELEGYEDSMLAAGVELPGAVAQARSERGMTSVPATEGGGDPAAARCERICVLATNVCQLRERICELSDHHRDELRYLEACERANHDCKRATEACDGCDG